MILNKIPYYRCNGNTEWRVVRGHNDYIVSCDGEVFSFLTMQKLKPCPISIGYSIVDMEGDSIYVHKLVAEAFIPNPEGKPCIDHINTNRSDNRVENLRWVTYKENNANKITKSKMGKKRWQKRILQVGTDGVVIRAWATVRDAALATGIPNQNITSCCRGAYKSAGGYVWRYIDEPKSDVKKTPLF